LSAAYPADLYGAEYWPIWNDRNGSPPERRRSLRFSRCLPDAARHRSGDAICCGRAIAHHVLRFHIRWSISRTNSKDRIAIKRGVAGPNRASQPILSHYRHSHQRDAIQRHRTGNNADAGRLGRCHAALAIHRQRVRDIRCKVRLQSTEFSLNLEWPRPKAVSSRHHRRPDGVHSDQG